MLGGKIKKLRKEKGLTLKQLGELLNLGESTMSMYESGNRSPDYDTLAKLAKIFNCSTDYLLGQSDYKNYCDYSSEITEVSPKHFVKIPIIGVIRAGDPILAIENIIGYEYADKKDLNEEDYFYLKVKGDSMNKSRIEDGDLVLVRSQNDVDDGDIAVVVVNGNEATLKRVYRSNGTLILQPDSTNPIHKPQIYNNQNSLSTDIKIIGKVINAKITF